MPRGKSEKNLTADQKNAIRLVRSAQEVTVTANGYKFPISRVDAIDAIENGKFLVVCQSIMVDDVMTGFNVYMAPVAEKSESEIDKLITQIRAEWDALETSEPAKEALTAVN